MNKGYTILESAFTILIISLLIVLTKPFLNSFSLTSTKLLTLDIYKCQLTALHTRQVCQMNELKQVSFNPFGNVNKANTILVNQRKLIIQLGFGRFRFE